MPVIKANVRQEGSVERVAEGADNYLRMLRDGTIGIADLIALWSLEGRIFTASSGLGTTSVAYGAGVLDTTEFDMHVAVPEGVVIIPLEFTVTFDVYGTTQVVECSMQYGVGSVVGTTNTADVPPSSNANVGLSSACTVTFAPDSGTALTTVTNEFWHDGIQAGYTIDATATIRPQMRFQYLAMESGVLQVIGPSQQLVAWTSAQAGAGFITFKYAELLSSTVA